MRIAGWPGAHFDTATTAQDVAQGPDREPSSARSAFNCAGSVESVYARHCVRGRCEPRTARGPVAVSGCSHPPHRPATSLVKNLSPCFGCYVDTEVALCPGDQSEQPPDAKLLDLC